MMSKGVMKMGRSRVSRGLLACATLLVSACEREGGGGEPEPGGEGPLYLIHSAVQTGDTRMNYFTLASSLEEAGKLDYARSLELAGRPRLYAAQGVGFFAIGAGESPTITRYEVREGRLVEGNSLSLQPFGVTSLGAQSVHFVSETKAYYKDDAQAQVIVWNPAEMAVEKTLPLPRELVKTGYITALSQWASRDGEAYFTVGWNTREYDRVLPGSVLVRIDTATDAMTTAPDERCRGILKTARYEDTLYFFSSVINGLGYAAYGNEDGGQRDCILRISPGRQTFDTDYVGSVATALGEGHVGTVISVTEDGKAWVQAADTTLTPSSPGTSYSQWYSKGWSWWHLPLETLSGPVRVQGEPGGYSGFTLASGPHFFISQTAADYSESALLELSSGTPKAGVSFPGFVMDVARIR
ncbi:MxcI [Archangium gephyra]|uniref:MxcI n=1 Tax=Archangium gephyra TaxID=48 RepID=UPI003B822153